MIDLQLRGVALRQASRCNQLHPTMVFANDGDDRSPAHRSFAWAQGNPKLALLQLQIEPLSRVSGVFNGATASAWAGAGSAGSPPHNCV
jgi:hypothetical protein